jgi:F-type H+-transporting ATPase subunit delta
MVQLVSEIKIRPDKIAIRYGGVLFDLAHQDNKVKAVTKDLQTLQACIRAEPQDWLRLISPSLPLYTQRTIVKKLCTALKFNKLTQYFLLILCHNRRLPHVDLIFDEFLEREKSAEGLAEGQVETAFELSDKEIRGLEKSLGDQLGKTIRLHQRTEKKLLGGLILRLGSLMIDGSTRTQLNKLAKAMKG